MNIKQTTEMQELSVEETHTVAGGWGWGDWGRVWKGIKKLDDALGEYLVGNEFNGLKKTVSGLRDIGRGLMSTTVG